MKKLFLCLVVLVLLISTTSLTSLAEKKESVLVGLSIVTQEFPFHVNLYNGVKDACATAGLDFTYTNANRDSAKTLSDCEDLISQGIDVLILATYYGDALESIYKTCKEKEIPIFFISSANVPAAETGYYVSNIGVDNRTAGYWGGVYAGQHFVNELNKKEIDLVMLKTNNQTGADRTEGFKAGLETAGATVNLLNIYAGSTREEFMSVAEDALITFSNIDLIYGYSAQAGLGAYEACRAASRTDVLVVGTDAEQEERVLIDAGTNYIASVQQFPYDMGAFAVELVTKHLNGEQLESSYKFHTGVYTKDGTQFIEDLEKAL